MQVLIHLVINGLVYAQIDSKTDILSDILSIISVVFIEQNLTVRNLTWKRQNKVSKSEQN